MIQPPKPQTPILVISLARAVERRAQCERALAAEGVQYEIIEALDGKAHPNLPQKHPGTLINNAVACYMSHLYAFTRLLRADWPEAIILEDDFTLLHAGELANVTAGLPEGWDVLMLHNFRFPGIDVRVVKAGEKFNRLQPCGVCTHGYAVSLKFARQFVAFYSTPERCFDLEFCELSRNPEFSFWELARPLIGMAGGPSYIMN